MFGNLSLINHYNLNLKNVLETHIRKMLFSRMFCISKLSVRLTKKILTPNETPFNISTRQVEKIKIKRFELYPGEDSSFASKVN